MNVQEVQTILKRLDIRPSKSRGQNFLIDDSYLDAMLSAAELGEKDLVLEIGPGLGVLTEKLVSQAGQVCAIELDKKIIAYFKKQFLSRYKNLDLIEGDALSSSVFYQLVKWIAIQKELSEPEPKEEGYIEVLDSLDKRYKLIANLPYQITSRAIRNFLHNKPRPSKMVVMVQKEVAQRMTAQPGQMSLLALAVQTESTASIVTNVPKEAYHPVPKVDSAIIVCDLLKPHQAYASLDEEDQKLFWRLARAGFSAKRKQLKKNLSTVNIFAKFDWEDILSTCGLNPAARAQELSVTDWVNLVKSIIEETK